VPPSADTEPRDDAAASGGVVGTLLQCFRYAPAFRRHRPTVVAALRIAGALVLLAVGAVVLRAHRLGGRR
jgi:hypothetical protein